MLRAIKKVKFSNVRREYGCRADAQVRQPLISRRSRRRAKGCDDEMCFLRLWLYMTKTRDMKKQQAGTGSPGVSRTPGR